MSDATTENRDPYKGFVDINIAGVDENLDKVWGNVPTSGIKAMNIKGFGCIAVRWNGTETYQETSMSLPRVLVEEHDGKFILVGK